MFRRVIAGLILGPALLLGSLAWWGFLSLRTVLDESRTETIAEELFDNDAVVDQIGANIERALQSATPGLELTDAQLEAGSEILLADPAVRDAIVGALATTHRAFLGLDDAPSTIDLGPVLASARDRIGAVAPSVAEQLPETFVVDLPTEHIPDASPLKDFLETAVPLLAGISVCMALLAFLTTSDRAVVLRRAARWAIGCTAFYLVVGLGVPYLLRRFAPDQWEVLAAFLTAVLRAALVPSIVLGSIGAVLLVASMLWPERGRSRAPRRSAAPVGPAAHPGPAPAGFDPRHPPAPAPVAPRAWEPPPTPYPTAPTPPVAVPPPAPYPPPAPVRPPVPPPVVAPVGPETYRRPTLPTRARPDDPGARPDDLGSRPDGLGPRPEEPPPWRQPTWVDGHGWVMDPDDPRDPPNNARWVDGVGWVVPGPPPEPGDRVNR